MKKILTPRMLPVFTLAAGLLGFLLRMWMFLGAVDQRGLLVTGHISIILSFVLTAVFLAVLFISLPAKTDHAGNRQLFPANPFGAAGCVIAAAGVIYTCASTDQRGFLRIALWVIGVLAALSLLLTGLFRFQGKRPHYLLHTLITVFFTLLLVCQYRSWIRETQFAVYFFPLLSIIFLMQTGFHRVQLDAHQGNRRTFLFCNFAAQFFCFTAMYGNDWPFYISMVIWLATNQCSVRTFGAEVQEA